MDEDNSSIISEELTMEDPLMQSDDDFHPPVSPMTGAEQFFLPSFNTKDISAFALASEIRKSSRSVASSSKYSVATDDFASACDNSLDLSLPDTPLEGPPTTKTTGIFNNSFFGKDVLVHTHEAIPENSLEYYDENDELNMSTSSTTEEHTGPSDVAANAYGKVKEIYGWGKTVPVVSPLLNIAESVASKVVTVAGTSFEDLDEKIIPLLSNLDSKYVNPAINAVASLIISGVSKGDETFRPIIMTALGPIIGNAEIESDKGTTTSGKTTEIPLKVSPEATTPEVSKPQANPFASGKRRIIK